MCWVVVLVMVSSATPSRLCGSVTAVGHVDGACSSATFGGAITAVVYYNQQLFVADVHNNAIRVVIMQPYNGPSGAFVARTHAVHAQVQTPAHAAD